MYVIYATIVHDIQSLTIMNMCGVERSYTRIRQGFGIRNGLQIGKKPQGSTVHILSRDMDNLQK